MIGLKGSSLEGFSCVIGGPGEKSSCDRYLRIVLGSVPVFSEISLIRYPQIHIDDEVSSLSAILLNEDYYSVLLSGKVAVQELSVLRPEYLLLFKAKAFLDLSARKANGEHVDSRDIKKHKNDILRIAMEFILEKTDALFFFSGLE